MKTKLFKKVYAILFAGAFVAFQANGQITAVSGTASNGCSPAAGTAGTDNVSAGCGSGQQTGTYTGTQNTCVGTKAGNSLCSYFADHNNTFIGFRAGFLNGGSASDDGAASSNTYIGSKSGYSNTYGGANTCLGYLSGYTGVSANNNICIGYSAGYNNTASANSFLGYNCGYRNTSGDKNSVFGDNTAYNNQVGTDNSIFGYRAAYGNGSANSFYQNSLFGSQCGYSITTGGANTSMGYQALYTNSTGGGNSALGVQALYSNTTGANNIAIGIYSLNANTTGSNNTCIGYAAGYGYTTGSNNTYVGYGADANANNYSNATAIGNGASVSASNKVRVGNTSVTVIEGQVAWTNASDGRFKKNIKEDVKGLDFIKKLRPVTYNFETRKFDEFLMKNMPDSIKRIRMKDIDYNLSTNIIHSGFIAQEVEQTANDCGYVFDGVHAPSSDNDNYGLAYSQFVVPLVKAVQELSKALDSLTVRSIKQDLINQDLQSQIANCCSSPQGLKGNKENDSNGTGSKLKNAAFDEMVLGNNEHSINDTGAALLQNVPNPFSQQTNIRYIISTKAQSASIMIFDLQGKLVKASPITNFGNGAVIINGNELSAGMFVYSLIVDGRIIDTKRMILTQ